ncbi:unnamed protein product, partial [Prorocentrum cordatum]
SGSPRRVPRAAVRTARPTPASRGAPPRRAAPSAPPRRPEHPGPWCSAAGGGGCRQDHAAELERFAAASGAPTSPTTGSGQRSGGSLTHDEWVSQAFSLAEGQLRACRGGLGGR